MLGALIVAVALAALRAPARASVLAVLALAGLTLSGHASSAHPRGVAIASDLTHLVAVSVWIGGIAQIAWTWHPRLGELNVAARSRVIGRVLPRFGRVALPAFLTVVFAGVIDAVVQVGSLGALWSSGYGRVLLVKATLVGAIALASYTHALRIRSRLLGSYPRTDARLERRHWRLLGTEPVIAAGVVVLAALLVAYPPPNRTRERTSAVAHSPAAVRGRVASGSVSAAQLSVAEEAGPDIVAAWIARAPGGVRVQVHALDALERPAAVRVRVARATVTGSCGRGCSELTLTGSGAPSDTTYELQAPDRFAFQLSRAGEAVGDTIIIGGREWTRGPHQKRWQASAYGGGGQAFAAASYLGWWNDYTNNPRVLDLYRAGSIQVADIATLSELQGIGPVWLRLRLDLTHLRLLHLRMITAAHFMTQTWASSPQRISPPPASEVQHSR